jgi:hypothetical protein
MFPSLAAVAFAAAPPVSPGVDRHSEGFGLSSKLNARRL